jgi:hypothetical protein
MVWIKVSDTIYQNLELITSIYVTSCEEDDNTKVSIVCQYGEFNGETYPTPIILWSESFKMKVFIDTNSISYQISAITFDEFDEEDIDYEGNYNEKMSEQLLEKAKEILVKLLNELDAANKKGNVIFDLEGFLEPYTVNN